VCFSSYVHQHMLQQHAHVTPPPSLFLTSGFALLFCHLLICAAVFCAVLRCSVLLSLRSLMLLCPALCFPALPGSFWLCLAALCCAVLRCHVVPCLMCDVLLCVVAPCCTPVVRCISPLSLPSMHLGDIPRSGCPAHLQSSGLAGQGR
jgi:hypothetical protein